MFTFYIYVDPDNDEQMEKTAGLLEALHQNYGVIYQAVVRVETDKETLVPMLKELEEQGQAREAIEEAVPQLINMAKGAVIEADLGNVCPECGNLFDKGGIKGFCSKRCYNIDYRKNHKAEKKPSKKGAAPNQAKIDENLSDEQARIDAVVAKAKDTAPGANFEHTVMHGGPIMARKL